MCQSVSDGGYERADELSKAEFFARLLGVWGLYRSVSDGRRDIWKKAAGGGRAKPGDEHGGSGTRVFGREGLSERTR